MSDKNSIFSRCLRNCSQDSMLVNRSSETQQIHRFQKNIVGSHSGFGCSRTPWTLKSIVLSNLSEALVQPNLRCVYSFLCVLPTCATDNRYLITIIAPSKNIAKVLHQFLRYGIISCRFSVKKFLLNRSVQPVSVTEGGYTERNVSYPNPPHRTARYN